MFTVSVYQRYSFLFHMFTQINLQCYGIKLYALKTHECFRPRPDMQLVAVDLLLYGSRARCIDA